MTEKLQAILEAEGLSPLLDKFNEQGVTDSIIGDLTDSDLKELGIDKLGERKRILTALSKCVRFISETQDIAVAPNQPVSRQEDFTYEAVNGQITITGFRGKGHAVVPERFDDLPLPVGTIGRTAFEANEMLTGITIPDSVICIEKYSFSGCSSLATVAIGNGVSQLESFTFTDCSCLTDVSVGSGVTIVEGSAFERCAKLHTIAVDANNTKFTSVDGVLFDRTKSMIIMFPKGRTGVYEIPDSVVCIGNQAFSDCVNLSSIVIPPSVRDIGSHAFAGCFGLKEVRSGLSIASIGPFAFARCTQLVDFSLPESLLSIGEYAFSDCIGLTSIKIPDTIQKLPSYCFYGCVKLVNVNMEEGLQEIDSGSFKGCAALTKMVLPDSILTASETAFDGCTGLNVVSVPSGIQIRKNLLAETRWRPKFLRRSKGMSALRGVLFQKQNLL